jgi:predicted RNA-binding protein with EMAP domain
MPLGTCDKIRLVLAESGLNYVERNVSGAEFRILKKQLLIKTLPMLGKLFVVLYR